MLIYNRVWNSKMCQKQEAFRSHLFGELLDRTIKYKNKSTGPHAAIIKPLLHSPQHFSKLTVQFLIVIGWISVYYKQLHICGNNLVFISEI